SLAAYGGKIAVAAHNGPSSVVVSGDADALEEALERFEERGVFYRLLHAPGAGHGVHAEPARRRLEGALRGLDVRPAELPLYSSVLGDRSDGVRFDSDYWGRNVREPVLFAEAIEALGRDGYRVFVEIAPHPILSTAVSECLASHGHDAVVLPSLRRKHDDRTVLLESLGALYTLG